MSIEELKPVLDLPHEHPQVAEVVGHLASLAGNIVPVESDRNFNPEAFVAQIQEAMDLRSDGFDVLLETAREAAQISVHSITIETIENTQEQIQQTRNIVGHKGGVTISNRKLQRVIDRNIKPQSTLVTLTYIAEARQAAIEELGASESYDKPVAGGISGNSESTTHNPEKPFKMTSLADAASSSVGIDAKKRASKLIMQQHAHQIIGAEATMWSSLREHVTTVENARQFSRWVQDLGNGKTDGVADLLEMFAVDLHDEISPKLLESLLREVQEIDIENVRVEFAMQAMYGTSDFSKQLRSWAQIFTSSEAEAVALMTRNSANWNPEVMGAFTAFRNAEVNKILQTLAAKTKPYFYKYQQLPSTSRTVNEVLITRTLGRGYDVAPTKQKKSKGGGRVTPKMVTAGGEDVTPASNVLRMINPHVSDMWEATDYEVEEKKIEEVITAYTSDYPHEKKLPEDLRKMLEAIKARPHGEGTKVLVGVSLENGTAVRSFDPVKRKGLSTSTSIAKDTRIVYAVHTAENGAKEVGVVFIKRHDEYDRWIANHY